MNRNLGGLHEKKVFDHFGGLNILISFIDSDSAFPYFSSSITMKVIETNRRQEIPPPARIILLISGLPLSDQSSI